MSTFYVKAFSAPGRCIGEVYIDARSEPMARLLARCKWLLASAIVATDLGDDPMGDHHGRNE